MHLWNHLSQMQRKKTNTSFQIISFGINPIQAPQGPNPELRMGHTATYDPTMRCIYVFGGSKNLKWFNDIHVLDIDEWKWELVKVSFISYLFLLNMEMRHLNLHPRSVTLKLAQQSSNHGYAILCTDVERFLISDISPQTVKFENSFVSFKANGKAPTRAYHSASLFRHELWIFGGVFPQPDPKPDGSSNDIYVFSPIQENWYMPIVMGEKPAPRSGLVSL